MGALGLALLPPSGAATCTAIMLKAKDGSVVHRRTAEFGGPLDLAIAFVPEGVAFTGTTRQGRGLAYTAKYAALGPSAYGAPVWQGRAGVPGTRMRLPRRDVWSFGPHGSITHPM